MITSVTINSLITFPYADFLRDGIITDSNNSVGTKSIPEQTHTVFSEIERLQDHAGPYLDDMGRYLRRTVFTVSQTLIMLWWSDSQPAGLHTILPSPEFCHRWFAFASWSNQLSGTLTCNFVRNVRILKKYPLMLHGNNDALRSDIERPAVLRQIQEVLKLILELESHCMQDGTSDPLADIVMADITEITYYMIEKIRMNIRQVKERSNRGKLFDALSSFKTPFLFKQSKKMSTQTVGRNVKIYATLV
ncbi:unnamed protein product [Fasciola hepatica]|uniref:Uncharacterized protein n=1 Tax=Fasciola hepatica TaxID=6192 RepID=A0ABC9HIR8_FASHE